MDARGPLTTHLLIQKAPYWRAKLRELVHLPRSWPLARLTIPLGELVDRLLDGYCFQILATNSVPDAHHGKVIQTATHLTLILAEYLADTIAWLMRSILDHESKILFDTDTEPLLTPGFWILPLYRGGEVGAKSTVDVVLQTPTCAAGPGHQ